MRHSLTTEFRGPVAGDAAWHTTAAPGDACEPGREFGFDGLLGDRVANTWHYAFEPAGDGADVTESFRVPLPPLLEATSVLGFLRKRRSLRDMRTTLERIKAVVEG